MTDYSLFKRNEHAYQNEKYEKTRLDESEHRTSVDAYRKSHLTPIQDGGSKRGLIFGNTVDKLLAQDIKGKKVLDYCCGKGDLGVFLAMHGADVSGIDISEKAIEVANFKANVNNLDIDFRVMDAENLDFPDESFDFVIGFEALHHVIIYPKMPSELARVMRPDGMAFFAENWGGDNPIFQLWRNATTLKKRNSAARGEVILSNKMVQDRIGDYFPSIVVEPMSLFYMNKKYMKNRLFLRSLAALDSALITLAPFIGRYFGESTISLRKS